MGGIQLWPSVDRSQPAPRQLQEYSPETRFMVQLTGNTMSNKSTNIVRGHIVCVGGGVHSGGSIVEGWTRHDTHELNAGESVYLLAVSIREEHGSPIRHLFGGAAYMCV